MKIVMNTVERIQGVEVFPIFSLIVFFLFFVIMAYLVFNLDKGYIEDMKNMPLEEDNNESSFTNSNNKF